MHIRNDGTRFEFPHSDAIVVVIFPDYPDEDAVSDVSMDEEEIYTPQRIESLREERNFLYDSCIELYQSIFGNDLTQGNAKVAIDSYHSALGRLSRESDAIYYQSRINFLRNM